MAFELVVISGPCRCGDTIPIEHRRSRVIGREAEADDRFLSDLEMSSTHFSIVATDELCEIQDLESTNGTFLNGRRVQHEFARNSDEIRAGNTIFEVVWMESPAPDPVGYRPAQDTPAPHVPVHEQRDRRYLEACELKITAASGDFRVLSSGDRLTIGRNTASDWVFGADLQLSSQHFAVEWNSGQWELVDLASTNGTFLNQTRIDRAWLNSDDEIRAGTTLFSVSIDPSQPVVATHVTPPRTDEQPGSDVQCDKYDTDTPCYTLHCLSRDDWSIAIPLDKSIIVGRSESADLSIPEVAKISSRHACFSAFSDHCLLTDLGSTNGTFVNGIRVYVEQLRGGELVSIGGVEFQLEKVVDPTYSEPFKPSSYSDDIEASRPPEPYTEYSYDEDAHDSEITALPTSVMEERTVDTELPLAKECSPPQTPPTRIPLIAQRDDALVYDEIPYEAFPCGSGLVLFRGGSARFDPIDVARRLLLASPGWMVAKRAISPPIEAAFSDSQTIPFEFEVTPLPTDDASWMLPWSEQWGTHQSMIVYSRSDAKRIEGSFEQLQRLLNMTNQQPWFAPEMLSDFLANRLHDTVNRFFAPLDAVLVELSSGKRWAYFAPKDLERILPELRFRRRRTW